MKVTRILMRSIGLLPVLASIPAIAWAQQDMGRHDFFYAGEGPTHHMYMVKEGKAAWHYHKPDSRGEISDASLMDDGNILFAHQFGITEITTDQRVVWSVEAPEGTEIHSVQPIGSEHVVYIQNGAPAKLRVMHIPTKEIVREFVLETRNSDTPGAVHGQFRNARLTPRGTIVVSHMDLGQVREYDSRGNMLRTVEIPSPWSAIPLKNDNLLITSNRGFVREVNPAGETVWEVDLRGNPEYRVGNTQVAYRLPDGNTIVNNWQWSRGDQEPPLQAVELTPDKKVVWELCWWRTPDELGPSTIIQPLDEPVVRGNMFFGEFK